VSHQPILAHNGQFAAALIITNNIQNITSGQKNTQSTSAISKISSPNFHVFRREQGTNLILQNFRLGLKDMKWSWQISLIFTFLSKLHSNCVLLKNWTVINIFYHATAGDDQ